MANQSYEEILGRLNIKGATIVGGENYAGYLVITDGLGRIDPSLVVGSSTVSEVTTAGGGLGSIADPNMGDIAILDNSVVYLRSLSTWLPIGYPSSSSIPFSDASFNSTTVQDAIVELNTKAVLTNAPRTVTATVTFNTGSNPPFAVTSTAPVANLTATNLYAGPAIGPQPASFFRNASNLNTGTLDPARLSSSLTYNITAARAVAAVTAGLATHADSAAALDSGVVAEHALLADTATLAITATQASGLDDGTGTFRSGSFYTNATNITSGTLPAGRITAVSHGSLTSGTTDTPAHALASNGGPGFMSAADKVKLDTVAAYATVSTPAFNIVLAGANQIAAAGHTTLSLTSSSPILTVTGDNNTGVVTLALDTSNLDAETLDGNDSAYYTNIANIVSTGTIPSWLSGTNGVIQAAQYPWLKTQLLPATGSPVRISWTFDDVNKTITPSVNLTALDASQLTTGTVNSARMPYKIYRALISQSGTSAPTATILENTLGGTPTFARTIAGTYTLTLTNAFTANKTFPTMHSQSQGVLTNVARTNADVLTFYSALTDGNTIVDNALSEAPIEILVYP